MRTRSRSTRPQKTIQGRRASQLSLYKIKGDGACQFRAIAYWLQKFGYPSTIDHLVLRHQAVQYILNDWKRFKESVKFADGYTTKKEFEKEMKKPYTYGGEATLVALADIYNVNFVVLQDNMNLQDNGDKDMNATVFTNIENIETGNPQRPQTMIMRRIPETMGEPHYDVLEFTDKTTTSGRRVKKTK